MPLLFQSKLSIVLNQEDRVLIRIVELVEKYTKADSGGTLSLFSENSDESTNEVVLGLEVKNNEQERLFNLERAGHRATYRRNQDFSRFNFQYVKTKEVEGTHNNTLWDNIALTEGEVHVVKALKIIDNSVDRIAFIGSEINNHRKPVVKLEGTKNVLPLKSMGDGMNRILTIILALVNAGDGYLLIDEFENGLHHTVQEDLWKMIFKLAKELNVQVFATTHSDDCIRAFERVLNSDGNESEGQYFRLERFGDVIKPIFYSPSELEVATDQNIETR